MQPDAAPTLPLARRAAALLRPSLGDALRFGVAYRLLVFAVLSPVVAALARGLFALGGRTAVANADILAFALSPAGLLILLLLASVMATLSIGGHAGVFAIAVSRARGGDLGWWEALRLLARRAPDLARLAFAIVSRALAVAAPFLLLLALVHRAFLSEHDINFYLTARPPAFWTALALAALLVVALAAVLVERLVGWSLSLPLVALAGVAPREALRASREVVTRRGRFRALLLIASGPVAVGLAAGVLGAAVAWTGDLGLAAAGGRLRATAVVLGLLAIAETLLALVTSILGASATVFAATALHEDAAPESFPEAPAGGAAAPARAWLRSRRARWAALASVTVGALLVAGALLSGISTPGDVRCIAHRAGGALGPENSLTALRASIAAGADVAEIDVQRSSDGVVVVVHDRDLMKIAGLPWRVAETQAAALTAAPADGGAGLATLADFCAAARGALRLCVELKYYGWDEELVPATLAVLREAGVLGTSEVMSLEARAVEQLRRLAPEVRTGFLSSVALGRLTRLDVDFLAVADKAATTALVRDARAQGMDVYAWTLNARDPISDAVDRGIVGVITDDPALVGEVLAEREELTDVERLLLRFGALHRR